MALLELSFADTQKLKQEGRTFDCAVCPKYTQKRRRCREPKEDFTSDDDAIFPIYVQKGGPLYGFCPAKATWDIHTVERFRLLSICAESGALPWHGGIYDQTPDDIDDLSWFLPQYDQYKWNNRMSSLFGGDDKKTKGKIGSQSIDRALSTVKSKGRQAPRRR